MNNYFDNNKELIDRVNKLERHTKGIVSILSFIIGVLIGLVLCLLYVISK